MSYFDRLLVAPSPAQLVLTLLEATAAANSGLAILSLGRDHWESVAAGIAGQLEGRRGWADLHRGETARIALTWWTDHVERRHVRVVAGNSRDRVKQLTEAKRHDSRPPLWHVYPDRVFYREKAGQGEWWGVCGRGTAGPPERIAWMGARCGVCHDRLQEGLATDEPAAGDCFTHMPEAVSPLFSPDGTRLAVVVSPAVGLYYVRVLDLASGAEFDLPTMDEGPQALAFSPDGNLLAYSEGLGLLLVYDLAADELDTSREHESIRRMAFSPDGHRLAIAGAGVRLWNRVGRGAWVGMPDYRPFGEAAALAFAPSGWLAVGGPGRLRVIEGQKLLHTLDALVPPRHVVMEAAFLDERRLVYLSDPEWPTGEDSTLQIVELTGEGGTAVRTQALAHTYRLRLSPCGRHLVVLFDEAKKAALFDVLTGAELGRVGWDTETPLDRAVLSPDGRTLALVDRSGTVKLVPWALLLA